MDENDIWILGAMKRKTHPRIKHFKCEKVRLRNEDILQYLFLLSNAIIYTVLLLSINEK